MRVHIYMHPTTGDIEVSIGTVNVRQVMMHSIDEVPYDIPNWKVYRYTVRTLIGDSINNDNMYFVGLEHKTYGAIVVAPAEEFNIDDAEKLYIAIIVPIKHDSDAFCEDFPYCDEDLIRDAISDDIKDALIEYLEYYLEDVIWDELPAFDDEEEAIRFSNIVYKNFQRKIKEIKDSWKPDSFDFSDIAKMYAAPIEHGKPVDVIYLPSNDSDTLQRRLWLNIENAFEPWQLNDFEKSLANIVQGADDPIAIADTLYSWLYDSNAISL